MTIEEKKTVVAPLIDVDERLENENLFASLFGELDADQWLNHLIDSIESKNINGIEFPGFPSPSFQSNIHGHFGAHSLKEAYMFYKFVEEKGLTGSRSPWFRKGFFLDFGSGWGRITRLFMRDFPLKNIIGYEPSNRFCSVARGCNPFVSFVSGDFLPNGILPADRFDLVVGWSVFSHLSPDCASAWLNEFQRVTRPGSAIVLTTWGKRFFERLKNEKLQMELGEEIHWYSKHCLSAVGDIDSKIDDFESGEFIWLNSGKSELYGESFISRGALQTLLDKAAPALRIEYFDSTSLPQDVFILKNCG